MGTIADLVAYRLKTESLIERVGEEAFATEYGSDFRLVYSASPKTRPHPRSLRWSRARSARTCRP